MVKQRHEPGPPMPLGNMCELGVVVAISGPEHSVPSCHRWLGSSASGRTP